MDLTIKSYIILFCIAIILLSPFYYLEYIKPRERNKSYLMIGHTRWIYGETECKILYTFIREQRTMFKVRYQNKNGRWCESEFYHSELSMNQRIKDPPNEKEK